jgi:hypothetical protein
MPSQLLVRVVVLAASFAFCFTGSGQTSSNQNSLASKVQRAVWIEAMESEYGISRDDFNSIGMSKLTKEEAAYLMTWSQGKRTRQEEPTNPTYSCGRSLNDLVAHPSVSIFVAMRDPVPSEIQSALRQKLRAISDVQIVYDEKDADLVIAVLGMESRAQGNNYLLGYIISVAVFVPCEWKSAGSQGVFEMYENHILQIAGSAPDAVNSVTSALDSDNIEEIRKEHALYKKLVESQKK